MATCLEAWRKVLRWRVCAGGYARAAWTNCFFTLFRHIIFSRPAHSASACAVHANTFKYLQVLHTTPNYQNQPKASMCNKKQLEVILQEKKLCPKESPCRGLY